LTTPATTLTNASFEELVHHNANPCVSIFIPIDRRHPDDRRAHLALKSLIADARAQLKASGIDHIDDLLGPTEAVLERPVIAEHSGGVALFLSPGFAAELTLDVPVHAMATTGTRFTVGPLLSSLTHGPTAYVLTVGAENVALHRVDRAVWSDCHVADLPRSIEDALWYERDERMNSSHGGAPAGASGMSVVGHGSGAQDEDRKRRLTRYFQKVDDAVMHFLHDDPETPLVIAGTAPSVARYQLTARHHHIVAAPIGSPEEITPKELHQRVNELLEPLVMHRSDVLLERLATRTGTGLASSDLDELVVAAQQGRVSDLLVVSTHPVWISSSPPHDRLDTWEPGATDLINETVGEAWRHGARVHAVSPDRLPAGIQVAALYRF
jgi:hypothetical protein